MRKLVLSLAIVLFAFSFISAIDMDLSKDEFYPGETLQLEIPNVFINNLQLSNIGIYEGDAVHKTPSEAGLVKPEKKYLYYAVLPEKPGNYSIKIEDIKYYEGSVQTDKTIVKNFTIIGTNESYLSFDPGYVYTGEDFTVVIKAYNGYQDVSVDFPSTGINDNFEDLGYGETKTLFFSIDSLKSITKDTISINSYSIPVVITPKIKSNTTTSTEENYTLNQIVISDTREINATLLSGVDYYYRITIVNKNKTINSLVITSSNPEIKVSPDLIGTLSGEKTLNITINSKKSLRGYINISKGDNYMKIPINIEVTEDKKEVESNVDNLNQAQPCSVFGGKICDTSNKEFCKGSETQASDGLCCIGQCTVKSASTGLIIGILIILILSALVWFLYQKSKEQSPAGEKLRQIFQKRTSNYEQRIASKPPVEVRKSLSKD